MTQSAVSQPGFGPSSPNSSASAPVNITYDKLFELLRTERNDANLQKLPPTFFADVKTYLQLKQDSINKSKNSSDLFAAEHIITAQQQIRNALKIIADITDRRERKIMSLALNKARTATSTVDVANLLAEEKSFFAQVVSLLSAQRNTLHQLMSVSSNQTVISTTPSSPVVAAVATSVPEAAVPTPEVEVVATKTYEVIEEITEFFGPDMQHYGPFAKGDQAVFSDQIARILLKKCLVKQI